MAAVFWVMLYKATTTGRILARGWGFNTRTYDRNEQPIWFWFTFGTYSIAAAMATAAAVMLALGKSLP